ncbi:ABC transporter permease [Desulfotignum phosphitoxidans]|uniref:Dipeptide transport system permease protein DppB n=3 Tax=Desulfotignum TaxID=115780 RepID=S0FQD3_9BACT|nr:ABC transporter permease [Desulfotignum phosphitoxidans]EMS77278.1 dipeptide transport system permease protein DppB [Desulfotignum phosphitoxidans DSM 13687]
MIVFILRRFFLLLLTMILVSLAVFIIAESSPGNIAKNVLGAFISPEQEAAFIRQNGLDQPMYVRYLHWIAGNDWVAKKKIGMPLKRITTEEGFEEWWAVKEDGSPIRWKVDGDDLVAINITPDGEKTEYVDNDRWKTIEDGKQEFWGIDRQNHAVRWVKGETETMFVFVMGKGWMESSGGPKDYIPLKKGFVRGDPGISFRTGRPVNKSLWTRLRNSVVLAGTAFVIVMPLALLLGLIAGLQEGSLKDRVLSVGGMMFSVVPEFATGIFLTLIFSVWLGWLPGAAVLGTSAPWEKPMMLILPVLTLTLIELGYILRITRASMVEVMKAPYIRTAFLKGLPYKQVVFKHAVKNALIAPITVIMLHVNWLLGGIVIVEVVFGYPGLGAYLLESALYKDFNALEAGAMIMVLVAVGTQLVADIIYTFLNPRIRYA